MQRMPRFDVLGIVVLILMAQACGGPTRPSQTATSSPPPPPSAVTGTIVFVTASPAPGSDVVVNPSAPDAAQSLTATFSVTLDKAVADVMLNLQLLNGADQPCGSGVTGKQNMDAGKAATFTVASITFTCALPATVEKLKATVVTAASGQNTQPTEYVATSFPARYAFRAPTVVVTLSGIVTDPSVGALSGATVEMTEGADTGKSTTTDRTGHYTLAGLQPGPAMVRASAAGYDNTYSRVTLSGASATQDLALFKPIKPDPGPLPAISALSQSSNIPTAGDPPFEGDLVIMSCVVRETDGAPMTVAITLTWDGRTPMAKSQAFPAGASSSESGARLELSDYAPSGAGQPYGLPHGKAECVGTNNRGQSVQKTHLIGPPR